MDFSDFLPKHKSDYESIEKLNVLSTDELRPLLPTLLEWIQDMNWPIALGCLEILLKCKSELVPYIKEILAGEDSEWKYNVVHSLLIKMPTKVLIQLESELTRLALYPSDLDKESEVDEEAKILLLKLNGK
ncbi:DUF5071 domain-containing protein [Paenibacillus sp. CN-4]|uniref:DUF5071 domain-containing protein n=1 Tax=Paenibacillus nanchangensis TaxID=3348343 RepID=UPI00397C1946